MKNNFLNGLLLGANLVVATMLFMAASTSTKEAEETKSTTEKTYSPDALEPFMGEISIFAGNFAPKGWAFCHGQVLPIAQYNALFSILGTTYGGDGRTTFALPDLRGRVVLGTGQFGVTDHQLGQHGGHETVMLLPNNVGIQQGKPVHLDEKGIPSFSYTGPGQPIDNLQPYTTLNYIIALQGTFPTRE